MAHSLAQELNDQLARLSPDTLEMVSALGRDLYFPKGILTQTAEARQKATRYNATIGIAREGGEPMHLPVVMAQVPSLTAEQALNYAPSFGAPDLRRAWRSLMIQKNPSLAEGSVGTPVVTCGITHGLSVVGELFADPGDTVWVPDQLWGNYNMIFGVRRGAVMARYPLLSEHGGLNKAGFAKVLNSIPERGKAVFILNFPNNPTGYSPTGDEAEFLSRTLLDFARSGRRIVAVCDDAYFGLAYEPEVARESLFARLAHRHPRLLAVKLDGATKEDYVWGLRVGFLTFGLPPEISETMEKKAAGAVRGAVSNVSQLSQSVVWRALNAPGYDQEKRQKYNVLKSRYDRAKEVLSRPEFADVWTPYPFNSGYFLCLKLQGLNAESYRLKLLEDHAIGVIATAPTDVRVAFSCLEVDEIEPLFNRMRECALVAREDPPARDLSLHAQAFEE